MRSFLFPLAALALIASSALAAEKVYTPPVVPPDANPATVAMPREDWLARVQANFDRTQGQHFDLVFDGDSITDFWQGTGKEVWAAHYAKLNAVDFGISGDRVEHLLWRLQKGQLDGIDPKMVVLMIGTNNMGHDTPEQIAAGVKGLLAEYLQRAPHAHFLLLAIFPRGEKPEDRFRLKVGQTDQLLAQLALGDRVTYLDIGAKFLSADGTISRDIMPDFLHPNAKGYQIWADAIEGEIDKVFPPTP